jgi:hypothetical protein
MDHGIERTQLLVSPREQSLHVGQAGDIGLDRGRAAAIRIDIGDQFVGRGGIAGVVRRDSEAVRRQPARDRATDAAAGFAKDAYENSGDTLREGTEAVAKRVQDNPIGALLVAGGIGFALAMLMTRPPRRPPPRGRY